MLSTARALAAPTPWRRRIHPPCLGEHAALTLVCAALICAVDRWRAIRLTEFEQRQLNTTR
jgi:hypothetical protein